MGRTPLGGLLVAATLVLFTSSAFGARNTRSDRLGAPAPLQAGLWKVHDNTEPSCGCAEVTGGSLTVTSNHLSVSNLHLALAKTGETACGIGTVTVAGKQPLHYTTQGDQWTVSGAYSVATGVNVTVHLKSKQLKGTLEMAFGPGTHGGSTTNGIVSYTNPAFALDDGGSCSVTFGFKKN